MIINIQIGGEYYITNPAPGIEITKWLGLIISSLTLFIGYKIYRSFDISKKVKEKQLNIVFALVGEIQKTKIELSVHQKDNISRGYELALSHIHSTEKNKIFSEIFKNINVKWDMNLFSLPYTEFADNPFLPVSIAKVLRPLAISFYNAPDKNDLLIDQDNFVMIYVDTDQEDWYNVHGITHINKTVQFKSVGQYVNQVVKVYAEIEKWLKLHGANDLNIFNKLP